MIMVGNSRGNGQNLARHLLSPDNERVSVHAVDGFMSDDLYGAFKEAEAVSKGTRCKKYLFSLSLNPPKGAEVNTEVFDDTIVRVEKQLNLSGQPKAVVFHEKSGADGITRRHCHVVWSRIDSENMKAIPMDYSKRRLNELAKELYLEHEWDMPKGFISPRFRDPKNFTLDQWQQAKRQGQDPREIKAIFQDCWKRSDSKKAFEASLKLHGYQIARGDRRGYVATDMKGEIYSIPKWASVKTKEVKAKLGDRENLPSLDDAKRNIADTLSQTVERLAAEQKAKLDALEKEKQAKAKALAEKHAAQRALQKQLQEQRAAKEEQARKERFNKGLHGLLDRVTGEHGRTQKQNQVEAFQASKRDEAQRDELIMRRLQKQRDLAKRHEEAKAKPQAIRTELKTDLERLEALRNRSRKSKPDGHEREP